MEGGRLTKRQVEGLTVDGSTDGRTGGAESVRGLNGRVVRWIVRRRRGRGTYRCLKAEGTIGMWKMSE